MYIHIGQNTVVKNDSIIGIFDLDTSTVSKKTRDFLKIKENDKKVCNVTNDLPKAFILCSEGKKDKVYICQYSPATIVKKCRSKRLEIK